MENISTPDERPALSVESPLLEVQNLSVHFPTRRGVVQAVSDVSFTIHNGESVGILGESGCGKSVMARSIMGLVTSKSVERKGAILFQDKHAEQLNLLALNSKGSAYRDIRGGQISMIFQEPMSSLTPVYTVGNQIIEAINIHRTRDAKQATQIMLDALEQVGLPDTRVVAASYPHQLSGGMRQRVMIALALACEPALLIADEPTTALDVTTAAQIIELLKEIQAKRRMAIVFITHDMGIIANLATKVIVMYSGQIVESGSTRQIFKNPSHPYTKGLLASVPEIGRNAKRSLSPIAGSVREPINLPKECRFRNRCPYAFEKCAEEPPLQEVGDEHASRCWLSHES